MRLTATLLLALAAATFAQPSSADDGGLGSLCGLARPVDALIGCFDAPRVDGAQPVGQGSTAGAQAAPTEPEPTFDPTRTLVRFRTGTSLRTAARVFERIGVDVERRIAALELFSVRTSAARRDAALQELLAAPEVAAAEREVVLSRLAAAPNDALWPAQSGLRQIGFPAAWNLSQGSREVIVAVLDTGVSGSHPDLVGAVDPGWDFVQGDTDASDDHGHGTAVAGVIGARANDGYGVAGVCWQCRILPVKVLNQRGVGTTAAIAEGIVWATNRGARVINLSLGGPGEPGALGAAVRYAHAHGALVVAAAGNDGTQTRYYPAALDDVLGVAGSNEADGLYAWSNRGSWVEVAAPGCNPAPVHAGSDVFCGTSSAAPLVAGLAALGLSRRPTASADEITAAIVGAATPLGGLVRSGRVNAASTLALLPPAPRMKRRTTVRLSLIPDLPAGQLLPGPRLGRPVLGEQPFAALEVRVSNPEASEPAIARAINALRRRHGLRALRHSNALAQAGDAHAHALGIAGEFTHDWPGGRPFADWIPRYVRARANRPLSVGENLLWSESELTPEEMVQAWLNSPPHRRILLSRDWREIGIGVIHADEAGGVYQGRNVDIVAAEFATR